MADNCFISDDTIGGLTPDPTSLVSPEYKAKVFTKATALLPLLPITATPTTTHILIFQSIENGHPI